MPHEPPSQHTGEREEGEGKGRLKAGGKLGGGGGGGVKGGTGGGLEGEERKVACRGADGKITEKEEELKWEREVDCGCAERKREIVDGGRGGG